MVISSWVYHDTLQQTTAVSLHSLSIWGDRSIALADHSPKPKGVRRECFIARLAVLMLSIFQFHVILRIYIVYLLSVYYVGRL